MATIAAPPVTKTTLDVLRDARKLYAANPSHAPAGDFPAGNSYCVVTALDTATDECPDRYYDGIRAFVHAADVADTPDWLHTRVEGWNAEHTTEEVLEVWDRAIAALEAEAA